MCVTVIIQNVLLWLECRHGDVCAIGQWRRHSNPVHTSIRRCFKSFIYYTSVW